MTPVRTIVGDEPVCPQCGYRAGDVIDRADARPPAWSIVETLDRRPETAEESLDWWEVAGADEGNLICPNCSFEFPLGGTMQESYKRFRPESLAEVIGQKSAVITMAKMLKSESVPHTVLFFGPSGCGKTTLARLLAKYLKCVGRDVAELNAANYRGIDMVRELQTSVPTAPWKSPCRVWIIDECHQLTAAAQEAFLKLLEDTPPHAYFLLCTTEPTKLKRTITGRASKFKLDRLKDTDLRTIIQKIAEKAGWTEKLSDALIARIIDCADGSARDALQSLDAAMQHAHEADMLEAVNKSNTRRDSYEVFQHLLKLRPGEWDKMAAVLREVDTAEAEGIRRMVLTITANMMLKNKGPMARMVRIVSFFRDNFYDAGAAGLVEACYQVLSKDSL